MNIEAIYHHPSGAYAYGNGPDTLQVRLRTSARFAASAVVSLTGVITRTTMLAASWRETSISSTEQDA